AAAILAARDGGTFAAELTALDESMVDPRKAGLPISDLKDLEDDVHVTLLPSIDGEETPATRSRTEYVFSVGLCVEAMCAPEDVDRQSKLLNLSQHIANQFKHQALETTPGIWSRTRTVMRIDRQRLKERSLFLSFRHVIWTGRGQ
ncbi:MAG: hypothetical protein ACYTGL_14715, partial [Planctomycetota bacterium]